MSVVRFISDYHFSHQWMAEKRGFSSIEEHDQHIINVHNSIVHKKDLTIITGDFSMENSRPYHLLDQMNGRKIAILGNHDRPQDVPELMKYVEKVAGMYKYKGIFVTHCPIYHQELDYRVSYNIHGHLHEKELQDSRYINVCCELVDYKPQTLEQLLPGYQEARRNSMKSQ